MYYHGSTHVLIFFNAPQLLDHFLDWYVMTFFYLLIVSAYVIVCITTKIFMQVQSLPRMIIKEEIGEQVNIPWHFPNKICIYLNPILVY